MADSDTGSLVDITLLSGSDSEVHEGNYPRSRFFPGEQAFDDLYPLLRDHFLAQSEVYNFGSQLSSLPTCPPLTQELFFSICDILIQARGHSKLPQTPSFTSGCTSAKEFTPEKILPGIISVLRTWRLLPVESRIRSFTLKGLAVDLAALVNCHSVTMAKNRGLRIKWIGREENFHLNGLDLIQSSKPRSPSPVQQSEFNPKSKPHSTANRLQSSSRSPYHHNAVYRNGCSVCRNPRNYSTCNPIQPRIPPARSVKHGREDSSYLQPIRQLEYSNTNRTAKQSGQVPTSKISKFKSDSQDENIPPSAQSSIPSVLHNGSSSAIGLRLNNVQHVSRASGANFQSTYSSSIQAQANIMIPVVHQSSIALPAAHRSASSQHTRNSVPNFHNNSLQSRSRIESYSTLRLSTPAPTGLPVNLKVQIRGRENVNSRSKRSSATQPISVHPPIAVLGARNS